MLEIVCEEQAGAKMLNKPKALLLDFGGVVAETIPREGWLDELSTQLQEEFRAAGVTALPLERIQEGIVGGRKTASRWKNVQSRVYSPPELQYETFWVDFVAADWPQDVRDYLYDNAKRLRSEEHTSELQSRGHLVCRLLLEKKNAKYSALRSNNANDRMKST